MAIGINAGTPVGASGTVNVTDIPVNRPALNTNDLHVIAASCSVTGGLATPAGYTLAATRAMENPVGGVSSSTFLYVFTKQGPVVGAATVNVAATSTNAGRIAAVPFTLTGVAASSPLESFDTAGTLTAPTLTSVDADILITVFGVREGIGHETDGSGLSFGTASGGMLEIGEVASVVSNGTTQVATAVDNMNIGPGGTGAKTATCTAAVGTTTADYRLTAAISLAIKSGVVVLVAPDAPVIAAAGGNGQVLVTWSQPYDGGSTITSYTLQRRTYTGSTPGAWATINSPTGTATSYNDTGRANGTRYGYQLLATNGQGSSAYSAEATATPASTAPGTGYIGYLQTVPGLLHHWELDDTYTVQDVVGSLNFTNHNSVTFSSAGATFTGGTSLANGKYLEVADDPDLSLTGMASKGWTILAFITVTDWSQGTRDPNNTAYCHILGKADSYATTEWMFRHYFAPVDPSGQSRQYRMSCYYFNPTDEWNNQHLGAGSYDQVHSAASPTTERVMAATFDLTTTSLADGSASTAYPGASHLNFNGGSGTDTDGFDGAGTYKIHPQHTSSPFRVGTVHDGSFFIGRVRRISIFNRKLSDVEINALYAQRALPAGGPGGLAQATAPGAPTAVTALRSTGDASLVTVTWQPPASDGGSAITAYQVFWQSGTNSFTSADQSAATRSYVLTGVPTNAVGVTVRARNSINYGAAAMVTVPVFVPLAPVGTLSDTFNGAVDAQRAFDAGVAQRNGQLEWDVVDATARGTWVRGSMAGQSAFYLVQPAATPNTVGCLFVRSTQDRSKQFRIACINGALVARYTDGTTVLGAAQKAYSAGTDKYWRVSGAGGSVTLQTSGDGTAWVTVPGWPSVTAPAWFADVEVGVEQYSGSALQA